MATTKRQTVRAEEPLHKPLVLVVDDEDSICATLTSVLRDEDFDTLVSNDGIDAVLKVKSFEPDVVFLDIWMPGCDGIETLEKIKQVSPRTQVIMMSGHATIATALEATKRGAFDFIEKPLALDSVLQSSVRALEKKRSEELDAEHSDPLTRVGSERKTPGLFTHPGLLTPGLRGANLGQRTLKQSAILYGHCLHSGQKSGLILEPLPRDSGIHFGKIGYTQTTPAHVDFVQSTSFATTVRSGANSAATIEHLLSALHAYKISNLLIKCNGEIPIFDGSANEFCSVIESVGIEEQGGDWFEIAIDRPIRKVINDKQLDGQPTLEEITIEPADAFVLRYELLYPAPIGEQTYEFTLDSIESYKREIAPARTFGFMKDIERLQKAGLAAGGRLDNFILIGQEKVVNTELRFADELVRHKILDCIGDLFLIGRPLRGKVTARMTGHSDNIELLRAINASVKAAAQ